MSTNTIAHIFFTILEAKAQLAFILSYLGSFLP